MTKISMRQIMQQENPGEKMENKKLIEGLTELFHNSSIHFNKDCKCSCCEEIRRFIPQIVEKLGLDEDELIKIIYETCSNDDPECSFEKLTKAIANSDVIKIREEVIKNG